MPRNPSRRQKHNNDRYRVVAMLDLVHAENNNLHKIVDWQVLEIYREGHGFSLTDPRMYLYTALMQDDQYYTEEETLVDAIQVAASSYPDLKLCEWCGCREIRLHKNPIGQHVSHSMPHGVHAVQDMPMRVIAFDKKYQAADSCARLHRSLHPVIYAEPLQYRDDCVNVWCPTRGYVNVIKTPIPVCLSPYNVSLHRTLNPRTMQRFFTDWQRMVSFWLRSNNCGYTFIGYDFTATPRPSDDKINHILSQDEINAISTPQPYLSVPYDPDNMLGRLDITSRPATIRSIRSGRIEDTDSKSTVLGL